MAVVNAMDEHVVGMSVLEAAQRLQVSKDSVRLWLRRGLLERVPVSGMVVVEASSVEALRLSRKAHPPRRGRPPKPVAPEPSDAA